MPDLEVAADLLVEEAGGANRQLRTTDFATAATGAAKESSLQALLTELGPKLEPADLAALATAAKQDAAKAVLDSVLSALTNRYGGGKKSKTVTATTTGDTTIVAPALGKKLKVFWVSALNDPDEAATPRIVVKFRDAGDELYRTFAVAHWEVFEGAADEPLIVNLSEAGQVAVTVHYQEV